MGVVVALRRGMGGGTLSCSLCRVQAPFFPAESRVT